MKDKETDLILSGLFVYPIKSLKGIALTEASVEERGLQYDRRWMLIDKQNRFISQRENPKLALVAVKLVADGLEISAAGRQPLQVPFTTGTGDAELVQIWKNNCPAKIVSDEANAWFSEVLGEACRLVYMPDETERRVDPEYSITDNDIVSFADAYPFLIATEGSLNDLNSRLAAPVMMNRFRPNFVVSGSSAFVEDGWKLLSIGDTSFHVVKPCSRCVMTTVDQASGVRNGEEPLRTLSTYRRKGNEVWFGQNLVAAGVGGRINLGDRVRVLEMV